MIDAKKAAESAVAYFGAVTGSLGPIGFAVQKTEQVGDTWIVSCSYFDFLGARERTSYRVEVDATSGEVRRVEAVPAA